MTPFKGAQYIMGEPSQMFDNYPFTQQAFITMCNVLETTVPGSTIGDVVKILKELDRLGYKISYK